MFRMGGSSGTGITSGLDRTGYAGREPTFKEFLDAFDKGQKQQQGQNLFRLYQDFLKQQQALTGGDARQLGTLGALNQAQAEADAAREAARQATFLPQQNLDRFAAQVTGLMGGYPGQTQQTVTPNPTPLQTALGVGTTLAGIYGGLNPPVQRFKNVT